MVRILIQWCLNSLPVIKNTFTNTICGLSLRVPALRIFCLLFFFMACATASFGQEQNRRAGSQIIDDTTKQIYGPTTSQFFLKDDIFANRWVSYPIDTVIKNFHRFSPLQQNQYFYQDLGNIGTATRRIFEPVSDAIGVSSGFNVYNLYWDLNDVKYYNTKSPYSNMNVIIGGKGRSITNITYSRNIISRWNFGFHFNGLFIDKQVQRQGKGDRNSKANYYDLFTSYTNKDSSYIFLATFRRMYHRVFEYGGVKVEDDFTNIQFFRQNAQPWLTDAESNELRRNYQIFHQYKIGEALQVYHQIDSDRKRNRFYDNYISESYKEFFDAVIVDSTLTRDEVKFNTIRNEGGIKGNLLKLFYNGYVAWRNYDIDYKYINEDYFDLETSGNEFYVGGRIALQLDSLIEVRGHMETMLDERYKIAGSIKTKWFAASIKRSVSSPTFLQQAYRGGHDFWVNAFHTVEASELKGNLIYRSSWLNVYPGVRFATFKNYIFFKKGDFGVDQKVLPVQSTGFQTIASPELSFSIMPFRNTTLSAQGIYTRILENADDAMQVPELFVNAQLAYANIWVHGNFDFQVGVDVHWKSEYYAYGYDPAIQQYYTQQQVKAPDFPLVDLFLNAKIIRGRIFLKYNNLLKAFTKSANIPTPFYPGVVNVIDFGFDWSFYD